MMTDEASMQASRNKGSMSERELDESDVEVQLERDHYKNDPGSTL